ncbi:MAG: repair protein RecN [Actinomycetota bacterium]|jgi:DNA repair protein RecN (Recombination protein N)|nr:repair protein RecN [Actinomycetota bacterium]
MLVELHVRDLGVIADLTLVLRPGMTALTGETGAGKTLVVEAIELLVGGRADPVLVRPGADEARVEGRFVAGDDEVVLARAIPRTGRSRAYVDGRLATVAELAEIGRRMVDLHGQHDHQSLLGGRVQRAALDRFGAVDLAPLAAAKEQVAALDAALAALGGDARARAREIDLLAFQVGELDAAGLTDPGEEDVLEAEEDFLAAATAHRQAGVAAHAALRDDGGAADAVALAIEALAGRTPFAEIEFRLRSVAAELDEAAADARQAADAIAEDPERLDQVRSRRRLLRELCRKYGERLSDVLEYRVDAHNRLAELHSHDERVTELEKERIVALAAVEEAAAAVGRARREAAPRLAAAVERHLRELALPRARFEVSVADDDPAGGTVTFLLGANPGEAALPLAKVASGGELARTMLACRLVLSEAPPTLVFDEVDAGVGGQAALAVGRALAELGGPGPGDGPGDGDGDGDGTGGQRGAGHQVLVVTHLAQVAAFADHQVAVTKDERDGRTVADVHVLDDRQRVVELSRMLSGQPSSITAHDHAQELLATASRERGR